jgi:hypothetical protein
MKAKLIEKRNSHTLNKKHKIVCIGDSHIRGFVDSAKTYLVISLKYTVFLSQGQAQVN